ncbi:hypothetical protein LCGC14_1409220 [marine sediment metagenome]|uniref:HD domain-containing protein n=1 Tax=marine sediment metagenome TaxID=412755 RepID=A0A0F9KFR5_9ZZZZ
MDEYGGHWITTYTGRKFHFLDPQLDEIDIVDIAHALSLTCRFGGQCKQFYSVAEHSIRMAEIVLDEYKLFALLHDASEAYLPDLPRPEKAVLPQFKEMERDILVAIWDKFMPSGYPWLGSGVVIKEADNILLATEARDLMPNTDDWAKLPEPLPDVIVPYPCRMAEEEFLNCFDKLGGIS